MKSLKTRALVYSLIILLGAIFAAPNMLPASISEKLPSWYTGQSVSLGLDLRGGSQLLLALDEKALLKTEHQRMADEFSRTLREKRISHGRIRVTEQQIFVPLRDSARAEAAAEVLQPLLRESGAAFRQYSLKIEGVELQVESAPQHRQALLDDAIERSLEVVRRRLDESGLVEPSITRQGRDSILVQMPGVDDPSSIRALLGTTAQMTFHWVADGRSSGQRIQVAMMENDPDAPEQLLTLEREIAMQGEHIRDAQMGFNQESGQPVVNFKLDSAGAKIFGDLTRDNVGRALAIVLDNRVVTAPVIRGLIGGGQGEISGNFTSAEASRVSLLLRSGALPAPLTVVEERTIGPDLGSDAIQMGIWTGVLGTLLSVGFLLIAYGRWGAVASLALCLNIVLMFAILGVLGATLTLPGIAGLILSIGMATDANILINERIREENRRGRSPALALKLGFDRAYQTILDANITTLIAVSLLFMFGTGPVRGFAVTIGIGLLTSMFTAIAVTRVMMEWSINRKARAFKDLALHRFVQRLTNEPINVLKGRFVGLTLSIGFSVLSVILLIAPGLNYGIDFKGGTMLEAHVAGATNEQIRQRLSDSGIEGISLQELGEKGEFLLRLPIAAEGEGNVLADQVKASISEQWSDARFPRLEMVGAKVSGEFADLTIIAVLLAGLGMLIYLWVRFESHFALAATLTIGLDLTKTIGFFVLAGVEFNLTAVAALLALMGYSVNDKVVVFDRVRETLRNNPNVNWYDALNESTTATLSRTVFTSFSTLITLIPMAIAGGAAVASFALPMLFGIIVGTSSSIFVAVPILYWLGERRIRKGIPQLRPTEEEIKAQLDQIP